MTRGRAVETTIDLGRGGRDIAMTGDGSPELNRPRRVNRERVVRTLTFWLRPEFVLRVVNRFQKVAGFDRAIALASGGLTAMIPLMIVASAVASQLGGKDTAERIIERYELTGGGAEAVTDIFAPPTGSSTSLGIIGFLFMLVAVLSFSRGVQRLIEQTWALGRSRLELSAALLSTPLTAVFLVWSGIVLSAKRIERRNLLPFGILGAVLLAVYSVGATVYVPHLFSSYATRYGVIGAVFAMISALFCVMVVLVASATAGREIDDELGRIRRGERPADDEVQRQWAAVTAEAGSRLQTLREQIQERRRKRHAVR
jgi:membrane protein